MDGESALEVLGEAEEQGDPYRLCIIDWMMPVMNGGEVTRQIKSVFGEESVIVIASAYDISEMQEAGREAGASYFISKPMFQSSLYNVLVRIAGKIVEPEYTDANKKYDFTGRHFLVAEYVELNMEVAVRMLEMTGAKVSRAENGKIALELYEKEPEGYFDCIFLDINMPEMDAGMNGHIAKPIEMHILYETIEECLKDHEQV